MVRACWCGFIVSVIIVAALSIARAHRELLREHSSAPSADETPVPAAAPAAPEQDAAPAVPPAALPAADEDELDIAAFSPAPPPVERPAPEEFVSRLIDLACLGKLDELAALISPGAARTTAGLAAEIAMVKSGQKDAAEFERNLRGLSFEFESLPGGAVKVRVKEPGDDGNSEDFYLLPDGDAWKLAAESDLEERTSRESAGSRLKLLALCEAVFRGEEIGGAAVYAPSAAVLREGLDGTDLYAGVLDAEFARAVDGGAPYGDYIYGRLETGDGGIAHYATPAAYGAAMETLIIDAAGRVWVKDLEGAPPPAAWPGADPAADGWRRGGRQ